MRQFLLDLLKRMEFLVSPPEHCHHVISYAQYGSDEAGWEDNIALQVNYDGKFLCFFLFDDDFEKSGAQVADEIAELMRDGTQGMQLGIAQGQYLASKG
jgi:hypothetical protein